ncbi:hypothetical protein KIPB_010862 [Kipferlia bialata]|uniref:Uncharacterized protein n=1 Tax=Kipferlia bialata TaxID=797122 RepID=A0A9K3D5P6_9EUKA|nr:hypothetical protein KIPB_010862 [Kipferlia bialata]|eukprot:g10862.t1
MLPHPESKLILGWRVEGEPIDILLEGTGYDIYDLGHPEIMEELWEGDVMPRGVYIVLSGSEPDNHSYWVSILPDTMHSVHVVTPGDRVVSLLSDASLVTNAKALAMELGADDTPISVIASRYAS